MKISQVHVSLAIQYASNAIGKIAELVDRHGQVAENILEPTIIVARTDLERALRSLKEIPMPKEKD